MLLTSPQITDATFKLQVTDKELQNMPCGLHRATIDEAFNLMPELHTLYENLPIEVIRDLEKDNESWLIDVKIHMLMVGQFPCIPNWHCDNVPRDESGNLKYGSITPESKGMYIWLSGHPETEFLALDGKINGVNNHGELNDQISAGILPTYTVPNSRWLKMWQNTPHRGKAASKNCWRVFVRLTHKSLVSEFMAREKLNPLRRHSQVYLPYNFHW